MKENSIKEDIILLKDFTEGNFKRDKLENYKGSYKMGYFYYKDIQQVIERVLSDYTRVLKEIEELKEENKKYIVQLTDEQYRKLVDIIRDKTSKEWEDKIKAKILECRKILYSFEKELELKANKEKYIHKESMNCLLSQISILQSLLEKE